MGKNKIRIGGVIMVKNNYKIRILKDGPYLVSGSVPLSEQRTVPFQKGQKCESGQEFPPKEEYALCRCGHSKNAPYCDGTHVKIDFNGTETASKEKYINMAETIEGPGLVLTDYEDLCSYARFCHQKKGGVWELTENSDDPEAKEVAIKEACECPAGRLVAWDKESGRAIETEFEPSIVILQDTEKEISGPIWVRGGIPIESADGTTYEIRNRVTLCRCGKSSNKPFCDGTHASFGYHDNK